jgi:hypothetical protein
VLALTLQTAQANAEQQNRALRAAVNAEIRYQPARHNLIVTSSACRTCFKPSTVASHVRRRGKTALLEGNLDALTKLVTKGKKLLPEVVQDRRQKVGARSTA